MTGFPDRPPVNQPFPLVPLIGPRRLLELDDSLAALDIALTPAQIRWLETGAAGEATADAALAARGAP